VTNEQLYVAIGIPSVVNAVLIGLLVAYINAKFDGMSFRFDGINQHFEGINQRFEGINKRFDDMRDLWRSELHHVEEILGARLKHLEQRP
jgi:hypothetical protein